MRVRAFAIGLAVSGLLWLVFAESQDATSPIAMGVGADSSDTVARSTLACAPSVDDRGVRVLREVLPNPGAVVHCVRGGRAVAGVAATLVTANTRWIEPTQGTVIGISGEDGLILVPPTVAAREDGNLLLLRDGSVPSVIALPMRDPAVTVEMRDAIRTTVRCSDAAGKPLPGVMLACSRAPLPKDLARSIDHERRVVLPGVDEQRAIHIVWSGEDGRAEVPWLGAGIWLPGVLTGGLVVTRSTWRGAKDIAPPRAEFFLVTGNVFAVALEFVDDEIMGRRRGNAGPVRLHPVDDAMLAPIRAATGVDSPSLFVDAVACEAESDFVLPCRFLLRSHGVVVRDLRYRRLAPGQPVPVERWLLGPGVPPVRLAVQLQDPRGHPLPGVDVIARTSGARGEQVTFPIVSGRELLVPTGSYELFSTEPWIEDALKAVPRPLVVERDTELLLRLKTAMAPVTLLVTGASGDDPASVSVIATAATSFVLQMQSTHPSRIDLWLPVGPVSLSLQGGTWGKWNGAIEVPWPGDSRHAVAIELRR